MTPRKRRPLADRFWEKVRKTPGCWLWTGAKRVSARHKGPDYYGNIAEGGQGGATLGAHVVSWLLHFGPVPPGLFVLHSCDNRACVRPDHLFLGTAKDNTLDMLAKGRCHLGEAHYGAKLTEDAVRTIRQAVESVGELARVYGVSPRTIRDARGGKCWRHVA